MKKILYTTALLMTACMMDSALAQNAPLAPEPPAAPVAPEVPVEAQAAANAAVQAEFQRAQAEFQRAQAGYQQAQAIVGQMAGGSGGSASFGVAPPAVPANPANQAVGAIVYGGRAERALVVRTTEADPKTLAAAEEDLNIMGRILQKAISHSGEDEQAQAMGIRLLTLGGHAGVKDFQIEGFGAIFMLNVNFPLVGPANRTGENAGKETSNTTWDEARREIYGSSPGEGFPGGIPHTKEEFDPKRVEKLKDSLLEALKNAANMHSLKSDESVLVVVTSGDEGMGGGGWSEPGARVNYLVNAFPDSSEPKGMPGVRHIRRFGGTSSVMTIRAKKSDIDAFANGKLNLEEFRNKTKMLVY